MAPTLRTRVPKAPAPAPAAAAPVRAPLAKKKTASTKAAAASAPAEAVAAAATAAAKPGLAAKATKGKKPAAKAAPKKASKAGVAAKPSKSAKGKSAPKKAAPKPAPPSEVTLDHQAYPHLFDLIVASAPHSSLLALRGASKALCSRVDDMLAEHVVLRPGLTAPKGAKWARVVSVSGEPGLPMGPAKMRSRQHRCRAESVLGRLPGFSCDYNHVTDYAGEDCSPLCLALRQRWEAHFAHTRVLDLHFARQGRFDRQRAAFSGAELTVRVFPPSDGGVYHVGVPSENLVIFTDFSPPDPGQWGRVTTAAHVFADEKRTRRLVYNVAYDVRRPTLNNCWVTLPSLGRSVRTAEGEVVLIFEKEAPADGAEEENGEDAPAEWESPSIPETKRVNPAWQGGEQQRQNGWLWDVANLLRVESPASYTIVGATEVPHMCVGLAADNDDPQDKVQAIVQNIVDWIDEDYRERSYKPGPLPQDREEEIRNSVRFYSLAEYRELVGEEQWRTETVPTDP